MKKITISLVALLAAMFLSFPLYAAEDMQQSGMSKKSAAQLGSSISAKQLLGMKIVSPQGENIGRIEDVKLNTESGRLSFVTISKGGVMGIGGDNLAVPLAAFSIDTQNKQATLTVDKSKLDNAPQQQADMSDEEFNRELQSYYGVSPAWQQQMEPEQMEPGQMEPGQMEPGHMEPGQMEPEQMESEEQGKSRY
jgi:sporulation protein YlmC with PRC-barrel domain